MNWLFWVAMVVLTSVGYQLSIKLLAGQAPVYFITACIGLSVFTYSCLVLGTQSFSLSSIQFTPKLIAILVFLGLTTFGVELSYNHMYAAGAPITISRAIAMGGGALILALLGVLFFHEKLSPYQLAGIFFTIAGLVMLTMKSS